MEYIKLIGAFLIQCAEDAKWIRLSSRQLKPLQEPENHADISFLVFFFLDGKEEKPMTSESKDTTNVKLTL